MRKRLYEIIELAEDNDKLSEIYDFIMMIAIVASLVPLAFKTTNIVFEVIEYVCLGIFILDYILRLITADYKMNKSLAVSVFLYPLTPMAIIDLLSLLPSMTLVNKGLKILKVFRLFRVGRVLRVFKFLRYSKSIDIIIDVFRRQKNVLTSVVTLAVAYIMVSALVIYNVEAESFNTFFDAIYWATISLTTVGYGDIYPVTVIGRVVAMISSVFGIAIIALPSGVITAGYINEISKNNKKTENE